MLTTAPRVIHYHRLGDRRGAKRLWLEGRRLTDAGFTPGTRFSLRFDEATRTLRLSAERAGDHMVSQRRRGAQPQPIIDVCNRSLNDLMRDADRAAVEYGRAEIIVRIHEDHVAERRRADRLRTRLAAGEPLALGSVCHGVGILDHALHTGLHQEGVTPRLAFAIEREPALIDTSIANNPIWHAGALAIIGDIRETELAQLPEIDVLVASLPCTAASQAGRSKKRLASAEDDAEAGLLFLPFLDIVRRTNPAAIVFENVPAFGSTVGMTAIARTLEQWGYSLRRHAVTGGEHGAVDNRRRLVLVATTHGIAPVDVLPRGATPPALRDLLEPIPADSPLWRDATHLAEKEQNDVAAGKGFRQHILDGSEHAIASPGAGYRRWRSTEPRLAHPTDPSLQRLLTPLEHARAKTVPPELVAGLSPSNAHQALGNGVIHAAFVALGAALGRALLAGPAEPPAFQLTLTLAG